VSRGAQLHHFPARNDLGLADTLTDDARRRTRILDQWAVTLDAALKENP
jgi:hypothetical protein